MPEFEEHIRSMREALDSQEPGEGHEVRFLSRLEGLKQEREPVVRRLHFRHVMQIAASIAIILASAFVIIKQQKSGSKIAENSLPESLLETDAYYARQVDMRYEEISAFHFEDEEEKNILLDELKDLDNMHQQLMTDLEARPTDERVINALIRHYQMKLEVMDQIIEQLNYLHTETENQDENENV